MSLNFNSIAKKHLTVTLNDEKNTTLLVLSPTKKIMDILTSIESNSVSSEKEQTETLYTACAAIMSRNKGGIKVSKDLLEDIFDIEDIMIFFNAYMNFMNEQMSAKN